MSYRRRWLVSILTFMLIVLYSDTALAQPGDWNPARVPVEYANGVHCTFDATSIKRYTGLGGSTFVDVWVSYSLDEQARRSRDMVADGQQPGLDYAKIKVIKLRYLIWLTADFSGRQPLKTILAKQYWDVDGKLIYEETVTEPGSRTRWQTLDAFEQKITLQLVTQRTFYSSRVFDPLLTKIPALIEANEGFLGAPWGVGPGWFKGARPVADLDENISVYHMDMDVSPILGNARLYTGVWLLFSAKDGLVEARMNLENIRDDEVAGALMRRIGHPLIFEKSGASAGLNLEETHSVWHTGRNTRITLLSGVNGCYIKVSRRDFFLSGIGEKFIGSLVEAEAKTAVRYLKSHQFLQASSAYQTLPNIARTNDSVVCQVRRQLADLSRREECRLLLGEEEGVTFWKLKNLSGK